MSEIAVVGVVLTHGDMARGMVDAARRIAGAGTDDLIPVSNLGRTPDELARELAERLGDRPAIIFTDLKMGSCAVTARLVCRQGADGAAVPDRAVIFGVNLAMILDFLFHRDLPLPELVARLLEKGRESMECLPSAHADSPVQG